MSTPDTKEQKAMTEYASARRGIKPYESLAKRTGISLRDIVEAAAEDRLGELIDARGGLPGRPLTGAEALRRVEACKHPPGSRKPTSPAQVMGQLRALKVIWDAEDGEMAARGRSGRDPHRLLDELRAKAIPPWYGI